MMKFFEDHKGWLITLAGVCASLVAPKLGLSEPELRDTLLSIGGLVGSYVVSHNVKKGMLGRADIPAGPLDPARVP